MKFITVISTGIYIGMWYTKNSWINNLHVSTKRTFKGRVQEKREGGEGIWIPEEPLPLPRWIRPQTLR